MQEIPSEIVQEIIARAAEEETAEPTQVEMAAVDETDSAKAQDAETLILDMISKGQFTESLQKIKEMEKSKIGNTIVRDLKNLFESELEKALIDKIGSFHNIPIKYKASEEILPSIDQKAGYILDRIDGTLTFEDLIDVSGMPHLEVYNIIYMLIKQGIVISIKS
jgi:hypothetical protein